MYGGWVGRWWVGARLEVKSGGGCEVFVFTNFVYSLCFSHMIAFFNSILLRIRIELFVLMNLSLFLVLRKSRVSNVISTSKCRLKWTPETGREECPQGRTIS